MLLMAFNYSLLFYNYCYILFIFTIPLFFSSPVSATRLFDQTREVLHEDKTRIGSTPPRCYNKCNQCHPCTAVQVPTIPSLNRVEGPAMSQPPISAAVYGYDSFSGDYNRYSNYKPLGWKCHCRNHYYNP